MPVPLRARLDTEVRFLTDPDTQVREEDGKARRIRSIDVHNRFGRTPVYGNRMVIRPAIITMVSMIMSVLGSVMTAAIIETSSIGPARIRQCG